LNPFISGSYIEYIFSEVDKHIEADDDLTAEFRLSRTNILM